MSAVIMDGKALAEKIKGEIASRVLKLSKKPVLGTILVGSDPGSIAYVDGKHRDCAQVGIKSIKVNLPDSATTAQVLAAVEELNQNLLFICPNIGAMIDEKIYYYAKYTKFLGILEENKKIPFYEECKLK